MIPDDEVMLRADPGLVADWIAGWALSRGVSPPIPVYGGFRVDVGLPDQKARYVFAGVCEGLKQVADVTTEPNVFLKVCVPPGEVRPFLSEEWLVEPISYMMIRPDLRFENCGSPAGYNLQREIQSAGGGVAVSAEDGILAASGRVFCVGSTAVFDQIVTHPDHRRRGLGRTVMKELEAMARRRGATRGALVATPDGRALYRTMGWTLHSLYTTAVRA